MNLPQDIQLYLKVKKKIDREQVYNLTGFVPHEKQKVILDTYFDGKFNVMTITCGRRFGKTYAISEAASTELLIPNASVLLITPTFSNAKIMFGEIEKTIRKVGIKVTSRDAGSLTFTVENGSIIFVVTPKSIANALGRKFSLVIVDEGQDIDGLVSLFENYIEPAMADYGVDEDGYNNAKAIFIGTARDKGNDLYKLIKRSQNPKKYFGYINFTFPTSDNPYIPKEYLERKRNSLDPIIFGREYEGKWSDMNDAMVYYSFNPQVNIMKHRDILSRMPQHESTVIAALDVGFTDNTGYLIGYVEKFTGIIYIIGEYKDSEKPLSVHQQAIKDLNMRFSKYFKGSQPTPSYIDPSAAQVANDLSIDYGLYFSPAYNKIDEGVQLVNQMFYNKQLIISDECPNLIEEIENLFWKNSSSKTIKTNSEFKHFDLALSTLRYLVATWKKQSSIEIVAV